MQRKALPVCLSGVDTVVMARTGSGKTLAFLLPILEQLVQQNDHQPGVRAVILSPTRELSHQTLQVFRKLASASSIRAVGIHGGEGMEQQFDALSSKPDVIIATPGRLAHHLEEIPDFSLATCNICVLDEADRLLEMGFSLQIRQIAKTMPSNCQKLLFSATMPKVLVEFTKSGFATDPTVVRLDQEATVSAELRMAFITTRSTDKDAALLHVLRQVRNSTDTGSNPLVLIFAATRYHVEYLCILLQTSGIVSTMIYGSLDQDARKQNLADFRSGKTPILIVTDVAARGIDVPLIDHVIHYHFPSSAKLFVHRSGRAARAHRIGYCWGLVEPEELPYLMDLHVFLGRTPQTSSDVYALAEMTPEMVHYGSVPEGLLTEEVETLQSILNSELSGSMESESLRALTKTCNNAMKQYRRTRVEASREGARRAKAILEGERLETGQRLGGGTISPHPLLRGLMRERQQSLQGLGSLDNALKREEFLRAMNDFRPKETVFEAFATGGGKDIGVSSQVDKGRTTKAKKHDASAALTAMKHMRRQMRLVRDKGAALVVAGSEICDAGYALETEDPVVINSKAAESLQDDVGPTESGIPTVIQSKSRISRAERKKSKANPSHRTSKLSSSHEKPTKAKRGSEFRDTLFFIDNDMVADAKEAARSREIDAAMQPSAATSSKGMFGAALRLENAMLDVLGDEHEELVKKQRMTRWDKSKRKFVQTTVGEELSGDRKNKRVRLESGQIIKNDKIKLGERYEKWQKQTNRSVGRSGVFDEGVGGAVSLPGTKGRGRGGPNGDEIMTSAAIKKNRANKHNQKLKNMKKQDRKSLDRRQTNERAPSRKRAGSQTRRRK